MLVIRNTFDAANVPWGDVGSSAHWSTTPGRLTRPWPSEGCWLGARFSAALAGGGGWQIMRSCKTKKKMQKKYATSCDIRQKICDIFGYVGEILDPAKIKNIIYHQILDWVHEDRIKAAKAMI